MVNYMNNIQINKINDEINVLKGEYTNELNTVNYYYWPIVAKIKRRKKNIKWYFTLACCLLASVTIVVLLSEITNPYWLGLGYGVSGIFFALTLFFLIRVLKQNKKTQKEWDKALEPSNKLKEELDSKMAEGVQAMLASFDTDITKEVGTSYEDILEYYNRSI